MRFKIQNSKLACRTGRFKNKTGFTLVELLVVISIIGILTIITASAFVESQKKSRDAARKANLKSLADAVSLYYADQGSFPTQDFFSPGINYLIRNSGELSAGENIYMKKVPHDDKADTDPDHQQFKYVTGPDRKSFRLYANLENDQDIDCEVNCSDDEYVVVADHGCCYVITSSNINVTEALK